MRRTQRIYSLVYVRQCNVNHSALYIGNNLLIEASYQICIMNVNEYTDNDGVEIYCNSVKGMTTKDKQDVVDYAVSKYANGIFYGVTGIFGLAFRFWVQHQLWRISGWFSWSGRNILAQHTNYWCSESIGIWWALKNIKFTDEDVTWLTPGEIYSSPVCDKIN